MWTSDNVKKVIEANSKMDDQVDRMNDLIDALDEAQIKQRAIKAKSEVIRKKIRELSSI